MLISKQESSNNIIDSDLKDENFKEFSSDKNLIDENFNKNDESIISKEAYIIENKDIDENYKCELEEYQEHIKELKSPSEFGEENNFYKQKLDQDEYSEKNKNYIFNQENPSDSKYLDLVELNKQDPEIKIRKKKGKNKKKNQLKNVNENINNNEKENVPNTDCLQYQNMNNQNYYDLMRNNLVSREKPLLLEKNIIRKKSKRISNNNVKRLNEDDYNKEGFINNFNENDDYIDENQLNMYNNDELDFKKFSNEKKKKNKNTNKYDSESRDEDKKSYNLELQTGQNFFKLIKNQNNDEREEDFEGRDYNFKNFQNNLINENGRINERNIMDELEKRDKIIFNVNDSKNIKIKNENCDKNFDLISNENNSNSNNSNKIENDKNNYRESFEKSNNLINMNKSSDDYNNTEILKNQNKVLGKEYLNNQGEDEENYQEFEDHKDEMNKYQINELQTNAEENNDYEFKNNNDYENFHNTSNNEKLVEQNNNTNLDKQNENENEEYNEDFYNNTGII